MYKYIYIYIYQLCTVLLYNRPPKWLLMFPPSLAAKALHPEVVAAPEPAEATTQTIMNILHTTHTYHITT